MLPSSSTTTTALAGPTVLPLVECPLRWVVPTLQLCTYNYCRMLQNGINSCCLDNIHPFVYQTYQCLYSLRYTHFTADWFALSSISTLTWQMGFDSGDGSNSYAHAWSRSGSIANLPSSTNCGTRGRYIYGVAGAVIVSVDEGTSPARAL